LSRVNCKASSNATLQLSTPGPWFELQTTFSGVKPFENESNDRSFLVVKIDEILVKTLSVKGKIGMEELVW
jgi:hypothetical protein